MGNFYFKTLVVAFVILFHCVNVIGQDCTIPVGSISLKGNSNIDNPSGNYYIADGDVWSGSFQNANSDVTLYIEPNAEYSGNNLGNFNAPNTLTVQSCGTLTYNVNINAPQYIFHIVDGIFDFSGNIDNLILNIHPDGTWNGTNVTLKAESKVTICGTANFTNLEVNNENSESYFNVCSSGVVNTSSFYPHGILTNDGIINANTITTSNKGAGVIFTNNGSIDVSTGDMIINGPGYINNGNISISGTFNAQNGTFEGTGGCFIGAAFVLDQNTPCDDLDAVSFGSIDGTSIPTVELSNGNPFDPTTCTDFLGYNLCANLPVELVSFNYEKNKVEETFHLIWEAAETINFSHFELEKSKDAKNWTTFETCLLEQGITNTRTGFLEFESKDIKFENSKTYFRLRMVDLDESYRYSEILLVEEKKNVNYHYSVYPNPSRGNWLYIDSNLPDDTVINISDINGKIVFEGIYGNDQANEIDISGLTASSFYFVNFIKDSEIYSVKFITTSAR